MDVRKPPGLARASKLVRAPVTGTMFAYVFSPDVQHRMHPGESTPVATLHQSSNPSKDTCGPPTHSLEELHVRHKRQKPWGPHLVSFQKVPEYLMSMGSTYAIDLPQHVVASGLRLAQSPSLRPAPGLAPLLLLLLPGRFLRPGTGRTKTVTEAQCQCPKDKPLHSGRDPKARSLCKSRSNRQHTRTN